MKIPAEEFKSQCLKLIDQVQQTRQEIVITKHGKPVAKLTPIQESLSKSIIGFLPNSVQMNGDIISSMNEKWEALQ